MVIIGGRSVRAAEGKPSQPVPVAAQEAQEQAPEVKAEEIPARTNRRPEQAKKGQKSRKA